jgi:hypothetical protein
VGSIETLNPLELGPPPVEFDPCEEPESPILGLLRAATAHQMATWLPAAFDKWGVKYRVVAGWQTRGRPATSGGFAPRGLNVHHTGTTSSAASPSPALSTLVNGRSDLPGPLCQYSTGYDGIVTIVAAGRANHAGHAVAAGTLPAGDGNALRLGDEVQTNGTQRMPQVQYDTVVLAACAVLDHFGKDHRDAVLHATTSDTGKWDLGAGSGIAGKPYPLTNFQADVKARLAAGPDGGFMADLTETEQRRLLNRVDWLFARGNSFFRQRGKTPDGKVVMWPLSAGDGSTDFTPPTGTVPARVADSLDIEATNARIAGLSAIVDKLAQSSGQQIDVAALMVEINKTIDAAFDARVEGTKVTLEVAPPQ